MRESEFGGPPSQEAHEYVPDQLPDIESTPVDKQAITERIMDRVIEAAENDRPLEREYELSHEIKDVNTVLSPPSDMPMQSIGEILQQQAQTQQNSIQDQQQSSHSQTGKYKASTSMPIYYGAILAAIVAAIIINFVYF